MLCLTYNEYKFYVTAVLLLGTTTVQTRKTFLTRDSQIQCLLVSNTGESIMTSTFLTKQGIIKHYIFYFLIKVYVSVLYALSFNQRWH